MEKISYDVDFFQNGADFLKNLVDFLKKVAAIFSCGAGFLVLVVPVAFPVAQTANKYAPVSTNVPIG